MGASLLAGFDSPFRSPDRPFAAGDEVRQRGATIRVDAVADGVPTRWSVDLDRANDADGEGDVALLVGRDHRLRRFELPAVGETVDLPWSAGPSRRFGGR